MTGEEGEEQVYRTLFTLSVLKRAIGVNMSVLIKYIRSVTLPGPSSVN